MTVHLTVRGGDGDEDTSTLIVTTHHSPKQRAFTFASYSLGWGPLAAGRLTRFNFDFFLDECEEVEHQCQKTIQQLEAVLGEPLQSYF